MNQAPVLAVEASDNTPDFPFDAASSRQVDPRRTWEMGFASNALFNLHTDSGVVAYLLLKRSYRGDFAASEAGINYLVKAEREGRIVRGFIVLAEGDEETPILQCEATIVAERLKDVRPLKGRHGAFYWLNSSARLATAAGYDEPM